MSIPSYPSIRNLGHREIEHLFDGPVVAQEKVDGSQISFSIDDNRVLSVRSKGAVIYPDEPPKLFAQAVESIKGLVRQLWPNWIYRGEYLQKPKHNALAYDRIPKGHIVLFDVQAEGLANFLSYENLCKEAAVLGLEVVPLLTPPGGKWTPEAIEEVLETQSFLGGALIEGIVFKNYNRFGIDHNPLFGKHVSEGFKEVHRGEWRKSNPTKGDIIRDLIFKYRTPARWGKAVQHLRDADTLLSDPRDIGPLMREVNQDVLSECEAEIKEALWKYAWPQISRGITKGLPEWYKDSLMEHQFSSTDTMDELSASAPTE
ncbi:MAG: hypothetical protein E6Q97_29880 [Desulfurellales bacterium]|nr:MAG: hypothetical protein E6Q97_29880 [Desulfurellales bacterium]